MNSIAFSLQVLACKNGCKNFTCQKCKEGFQDIFELMAHEIILHRNDWGFWCKLCSLGFADSLKVIEHAQKHDFNDIMICPMSRDQPERTDSVKKSVLLPSEHVKEEKMSQLDLFTAEDVVSFEVKVEPQDCEGFHEKEADEVESENTGSAEMTDTPCSLFDSVDFSALVREQGFNSKSFPNSTKQVTKSPHDSQKKDTCDTISSEENRPESLAQRVGGSQTECSKWIKEEASTNEKKTESDEEKSAKSGSKKYQCVNCPKQFGHKTSFRRHYLTHTIPKPFQCDECQKSFQHESELRIHMYIHTGETPFSCDVCGRSFSRHTSLKLHKSRSHSRPLKKDMPQNFQCDYCNQKLSSAPALRNHIMRHKNEKPFQCHFCPKAFIAKAALASHLGFKHNTYSGRTHQCPHCDKIYAQSGDLKNHMITHTGIFPFYCPFCNKGCSRKINFEKHVAVHTGEKPFTCDRCGKAFSTLTPLADHINLHTGAKPHECPHCGECFATRRTRRSHVLLNHEDKTRKSDPLFLRGIEATEQDSILT